MGLAAAEGTGVLAPPLIAGLAERVSGWSGAAAAPMGARPRLASWALTRFRPCTQMPVVQLVSTGSHSARLPRLEASTFVNEGWEAG